MSEPHSGSNSPRLRAWWSVMTVSLVSVVCSFQVHSQPPSNCSVIRFKPGQSAAEIGGTLPAEDRLNPREPVCYSLSVGNGQRARVAVVSGRNIAVSIPGQGDAREAFEFVTQRGTYEILVFPLFPSGKAEPFRIRIEVEDQ